MNAYHLPALPDVPTTPRIYGTGGDRVELRLPVLTTELLSRQVDGLREAHARVLSRRSLSAIVRAIGVVAERFLDRRDELRRTADALLPAVTGSSPEMVGRILDGMAADWVRPRLEELLATEFGDPAVLDGFVERPRAPGVRMRAVGPKLSTHYFSGNIPGIGVTSIIRSLLVRSATLGKTAAGEPVLPVLFARAIAEADPDLGECLAIAYWRGEDEELGSVALGAADAVIVYGGNDAVASVRARAPARARFLGYGHKLSFAVAAREAMAAAPAAELADLAALDVATFDQQGCVSPHLFYVERGGEVPPRDWARLLARSLDRLQVELPRGAIPPEESAAIRQLRGGAEFAGLAGSGVETHASPAGTEWTVIYDPDPAFEPSCLNRVVRVKPIDRLDDVAPRVRGLDGLVQTVGLAGDPERMAGLAGDLAALGASRLAPIGRMAWPPPAWHHDGRPPLRDLVTWCDWE